MENLTKERLVGEISSTAREALAEVDQNGFEKIRNLEEKVDFLSKAEIEAKAYKQIFEGCADPVIMFNSKEEITFFNQAAEKLSGYGREGMHGKSIKMVLPGFQGAHSTSYSNGNGRSSGGELDLLTQAGDRIPTLLTLSEARTDTDKIYTVFVKDIREQKRLEKEIASQLEEVQATEEELRQNSEELQATQEEVERQLQKYLTILEGCADAVLLFGDQGEISFFNKAAEAMLGFHRDEVIGRNVQMLSTGSEGDLTNIFARFIEDSKTGEAEINCEADLQTKAQETLKTMITFSESRNAEGVIYCAFVKDVSEMKRLQSEMKGLADAVNTSQATIEFTTDGTILGANEAFLQTMGYALSEVKGQSHKIFCDDEFIQSGEWDAFWAELATRKVMAGDYKRLTKDGKDVWITAAYNPVLDDKGNIYKIIKLATDITSQKEIAIENSAKLDAVSKAQAVIEFDLDGNILTANDNFLQTMDYSLAAIQGKHHSIFCDEDYVASEDYADFWKRLRNGEFFSGDYLRFGKMASRFTSRQPTIRLLT